MKKRLNELQDIEKLIDTLEKRLEASIKDNYVTENDKETYRTAIKDCRECIDKIQTRVKLLRRWI